MLNIQIDQILSCSFCCNNVRNISTSWPAFVFAGWILLCQVYVAAFMQPW